jgi:ABC-2 type transport system permease protein
MLSPFGAPSEMSGAVFVLVGATLWFLFTLMLSQAITRSVGVFFERGDLDLLLASPIAPRNVFLVRGVGVAISVVAFYAFALTPFAHAGIVAGDLALLALYPALAALALLATAAGMALTIALVRLLGARRARVTAQVFGALVGAAVFLGLQLGNLAAPARITRWVSTIQRATRDGASIDTDSLVWLPLNAILGRPLALALLAAAGAGSFALVVAAMARGFLAGTQQAMTSPHARTVETRAPRFRAGLWRNVLVKEWKLIARDPQVIARTLLQSIYLLPLALVWARDSSPKLTVAPALVLLAATLASGLAWLTVAAEDAPELLASAPVDRALLRRAKLIAALVPVWLVTLPLAPFLARSDPVAALQFGACIVGATISTGSIQLALPRTGRRRDLRRRGKGNLVASVLDLSTSLAWMAALWCLLAAPLVAVLPLALAVAIPLAAWCGGRKQRREFTAA